MPGSRYGAAMNRAEKADRIGELLDDLYPDPPVPLDHLEAARAHRGNDFLAVGLGSAARDQQRAP
jgi:hypothetical protein